MRIITLFLLLLNLSVWAQIRKQVTINQPQSLQANAGIDKQVVIGNSIQIGGNPTAKFGNSGYVYLWQPSAGLTNNAVANPSASPALTTAYVVAVTDSKGCTDYDTTIVTVLSAGIDDNFLEDKFDLAFDNNARSLIITNHSDKNYFRLTAEVYNILGQILFSVSISDFPENSTFRISCSGFSHGVYILKINSKQQTICKKFSTY